VANASEASTAALDRTPAPGQRTFATPEAAVAALDADVRARDRAALGQLFGVEMHHLEQGEPALDEQQLARFEHDLNVRRDVVEVPGMQGCRALLVGETGWVFPVPLISEEAAGGTQWFFDGALAAAELRLRRIGANELQAILVCRALVDAQREYFSVDRDGDGVREYAQRLASSPGAKDGLFWPVATTIGADGVEVYDEPSPVGPGLAQASTEHPPGQRRPYAGYLYRTLPKSGPGAHGGATEFAPGGQGTGGFAFIALPAKYGESGIATFMVGSDGVVYEFDLGPETLSIAEAIQVYDPQGWSVAREAP